MSAVGLAAAGIIDPAITVRRARPLPVDVRVAGNEVSEAARAIPRRLEAETAGAIDPDSPEPPRAIVLVGDVDPDRIPEGVPVSTVSFSVRASPNVRVISATDPAPVIAGSQTRIAATFEASGMAGRSSAIVLEQDGVDLSRIDHVWTNEVERFDAQFDYAPPGVGARILRVRAEPDPAEALSADNQAEVRVVPRNRLLKVFSYESRPSWALAFVRRALESDPAFDVAAVSSPSRGRQVRAGDGPKAISEKALEPYDVALIGTPESLADAELSALDAFARRRGGAVVLVPDRPPSGAYVRLIPAGAFEEVLVERPLGITTGAGARLHASELVVPRRVVTGADVLGSTQSDSMRAVILGWPAGAGHFIFSGALDAWRYRDRDEKNHGNGFDRFWRTQIAMSAARAPGRLVLSVAPSMPRPGDLVMLRAAVRGTEILIERDREVVRETTAELVDRSGNTRFVRLWPTAETGVLEARFPAPDAGSYDVRVASRAAIADATLIVSDDATRLHQSSGDALRVIAAATGGVAVDASDLRPLGTALRSMVGSRAPVAVHPARSLWCALTFAMLLVTEWALRRRQGLH